MAVAPGGGREQGTSPSDILEWRPRLRSGLVVERVENELLFISTSDRRVKRFSASDLIFRLVPLLTGERTVAELIDDLCDESEDAIIELCTALVTMRGERLFSTQSSPVSAGSVLTADELTYYDRQLLLFQELCDSGLVDHARGSDIQELLRGATVLICGVGGIGSAASASLAAAGVGELVVCDDDVVEESNLTRQLTYAMADVGKSKVDVLAGRLAGLNPHISVRPVRRRITEPSDLADLAAGVDLVICCADHPSVTEMAELVTRACWPRTPHIIGGGYAYHVGILGLTVVPGITACWYCLLHEFKKEHQRDRAVPVVRRASSTGVIGVQSALVGNVIAWEAIRFLGGMGTALADRWVEFDYWSLETRSRAISRRADCTHCG